MKISYHTDAKSLSICLSTMNIPPAHPIEKKANTLSGFIHKTENPNKKKKKNERKRGRKSRRRKRRTTQQEEMTKIQIKEGGLRY